MMDLRHHMSAAEAIRQTLETIPPQAHAYERLLVEVIARKLVLVFRDDNPGFDREAYLSACGFPPAYELAGERNATMPLAPID